MPCVILASYKDVNPLRMRNFKIRNLLPYKLWLTCEVFGGKIFARSATFPACSKQLFLVSVFLYGLLFAVPSFSNGHANKRKR